MTPGSQHASADPRAGLAAARDRLAGWLTGVALPLWARAGVDAPSGRFAESLALGTARPGDAPARPRVPPRQVYAFIEGARLGWQGDAAGIAMRGLAAFQADFRCTDATLRLPSPEGEGGPRSFDLYDQAFALFAYANAAARVDGMRQRLSREAARLRDGLFTRLAHPSGGFEEDAPRRLPLRANPHMHLFEAALAWEAVSDDPHWREMADGIGELALTRFIDPVTGALREFFGGDWQPAPGEEGRIVEPGHQFEWCWLLTMWGRARDRADALSAASRLFSIASGHGICPDRGVAIMQLRDDFSPLDPLARLWAQTEWMKAALVMMEEARDEETRAARAGDALKAVAALETYLAVDPPGLWRDKLRADGSFVDEPAPASSLYHIVCAISELDRVAGAAVPSEGA
ncbi:AGE family epimerase/isomerase [Stappia sp.]|uniref:AGE family epimerase/isomerase n=1 Tax=Stappia sp. TaxID=1870903 RepID=UPI003D145021